MISLKKYWEQQQGSAPIKLHPEGKALFPVLMQAYCAALLDAGNASQDACPALGNGLKQQMQQIIQSMAGEIPRETIGAAQAAVQENLVAWGRQTAQHYQQKTAEVKEILLVMAHAAESVGERDQRAAENLTQFTTNLRSIANLEDLSQIRASIEKSAVELKTSIDRMTAEGTAAIEQLRAEVSVYQTKLEEAEQIASSDSLTGLRSRLCVESHIEQRIALGTPFCLAIIDIDRFKHVNDEYGHVVGDELLIQFSGELKSACRATDVVGRWGGDEFIILLDGGLEEAEGHAERLSKWICGNYNLGEKSNPIKLNVEASIGLAEHQPPESLKELLSRADALMYERKAEAKAARQK